MDPLLFLDGCNIGEAPSDVEGVSGLLLVVGFLADLDGERNIRIIGSRASDQDGIRQAAVLVD